ncbi:tetratricopeptide repeat-containing sulfotransferase family protein [Dyella telluris]|uniref:Sulfotransferase n=1 Tax=Dyella telluris TaxID=2763498 RepID=A0A7G8PYV5_9GAMM|nr:sulfotransferase [Dyella telluris]QNJ99712.1 sulfotransferase [Dyella telluris]
MTEPAHLYAQLVDAFNRRQWLQARAVAGRLLPMVPNDAGVCYITGVTFMELQEMPLALGFLHKAMDLEPTRADYATQFAKALTMVRRTRDAVTAADKAMALHPTDAFTLDTLGVVYTQGHAHDRAATAFKAAATLMPEQASYRFNLATALVAMGDITTAEQELEACIALDATFWGAHLTLSQLRRQTPGHHHVPRLQALADAHPRNEQAQTYVNMALAKEHEDLGEYPAAFERLVRGKSSGKETRGYSIHHDEALFEAIARQFPQSQAAVQGDPTHEPIFVIGMPRSGTTLVERIISSHPDVYSAGELQNFGVVLKRQSGSTTFPMIDLDTIERARQVDWTRLGADYLASTRPATGQRPRFIDKLPHNFLYAGFIANALPNARIVCLRRDPVDTCLSNFRQLFSQLSPLYGYSFDLLDTGRYFVLFDRLMAHWRKVFPGRILEVEYEGLVDAQEEHTRRLLAFCDLPWDDRCLQFEKNDAPVNTASAVQVRAPIYRTAVRRWKKYEAQLSPLLQLLDDAGIAFER